MPNDWTTVIPQLLAQGLGTLRQMAIMPRLVNRGYEVLAGQLGSTVTVPIPSAVAIRQVAPSMVHPTATSNAPTSVSIPLDQWWEAPFNLTDKEMEEVMAGTIPMQAREAVKSIANKIDTDILNLYKQVWNVSGVAGVTPFATDLSAFTMARKNLTNALAPMEDRSMVINADAEANALLLRAFQDASFRGDTAGIQEGMIGRKLGATWAVDQNVLTHVAGTITTGLAAKSATPVAAGLKTFVATTAASTGACALVAGDILTVAGHSQKYVLAANATQAAPNTDVTLTINPGLQIALVGSEAITVTPNHVVNLNFHRDAFALAMRPFAAADPMGLGTFSSIVDPVSGLALRLEAVRVNKITQFSFDVLYGLKAVRPEFANRVMG